jgi:hypothetical protein
VSGYDAVMQLAARKDPELWLAIAGACHDSLMRDSARMGLAPAEVAFSNEGMSSKRVTRFSWLRGWRREDPGLTPLCDVGVLARHSDGSFYMPDPDGVGRALNELGLKVELTSRREIWDEAP